MKTVSASELQIGDIFAKTTQLYNREAFIVVAKTPFSITANSRNDIRKNPREVNFNNSKTLILLKKAEK